MLSEESSLVLDAAPDFLFLGPVHHIAVVDGRFRLHYLPLLLSPWLGLHRL